jgi:hypothetical protein
MTKPSEVTRPEAPSRSRGRRVSHDRKWAATIKRSQTDRGPELVVEGVSRNGKSTVHLCLYHRLLTASTAWITMH